MAGRAVHPGGLSPATVCLLTDYGQADEFAGLLARVVLSVAPAARVVDLTHGIARHDVAAGAAALWRAAPWLAPAVVCAVVDPGVATDRRAVAVEVATAAGPLLLVGPDNGLLTPAAHRAGTIRAAVALDDPAWHLPAGPGTGTTFAGRDVFAPAAGHLAAGTPLADLGSPVDPATLAGAPLRPVEPVAAADGTTRADATVWWVDTFGNAGLDLPAAALEGVAAVDAEPGGHLPVARSYAALAGGAGVVPDSTGMVAVALDGASAAAALGLAAGDRVVLRWRR